MKMELLLRSTNRMIRKIFFKKTGSIMHFLPYSINKLKKHIESQYNFSNGAINA